MKVAFTYSIKEKIVHYNPMIDMDCLILPWAGIGISLALVAAVIAISLAYGFAACFPAIP